MYLASAVTILILVLIIGYISVRGIPFVTGRLLTSQTSYIKDTIGILPNILNTVYMIILTMLVALPISVGAAIYLTEYAGNKTVVAIIEFATEALTGIPSIIYGLVGMLVLRSCSGSNRAFLPDRLHLS